MRLVYFFFMVSTRVYATDWLYWQELHCSCVTIFLNKFHFIDRRCNPYIPNGGYIKNKNTATAVYTQNTSERTWRRERKREFNICMDIQLYLFQKIIVWIFARFFLFNDRTYSAILSYFQSDFHHQVMRDMHRSYN